MRADFEQAGPLTRVAIILAVTLIGALWLGLAGPETTGDTLARMADRGPFWYMLTAFPVFGILLADLAALFRHAGLSRRTWELGSQVALQILLAVLRLAILIPISGHVLLMAYTWLRRIWAPAPFRHARLARWETFLVAGLLAWVSFVKLFLWHDPVTWLCGLILAIVLARISARVNL